MKTKIETTVEKSPAGRKPLPPGKKKKAVTIYLDGETIDRHGGTEAVRRKLLQSLINNTTEL